MKTIKILLATVFALAIGAVFAFTSVEKSDAVEEVQVHTYFVTGKAGSGPTATYSVQPNPRNCQGGGRCM